MSEVAQLCLTLYDPMDCSLLGSSVHGIFQARILEWVAISFSRRPSRPRIEPRSPTLYTDALPSGPPGKSQYLLLSVLTPVLRISPSVSVKHHANFAREILIRGEKTD